MPETTSAVRPRQTQARGRERRAALLAAARLLLSDKPLDSLSLGSIADQAGIPVSSAYHLFPDLPSLFKDLSRDLAIEMAAETSQLPQAPGWEALVRLYLDRCRDAFNADGALRQLMLGSKTPPEIKHAACREDHRFGRALLAVANRQFDLPGADRLEDKFFKAILIADVMFSLSVADHGSVTRPALEEAQAASVAYLRLFLPPSDSEAA